VLTSNRNNCNRLAETSKPSSKGAALVTQVSKPAVSPTSKSAVGAELAGHTIVETAAGLETRDTADLEVCAAVVVVDGCARS
jgi:hypothetical protein